MKVQQIFFKNTLRNFCYLIVFDDGTIYCIDPFNAAEVLASLPDKVSLSAIINTHDHCDHYSGNEALTSKHRCPVLAHEKANVPGKTKGLSDGEVIHQCGEWTLETIYTPGHTMSHICLLLRQKGKAHSVFTGDCFFNAGVGNCHNGGDPKVLFKTISEIFFHFPDDLLIYPGHEYLKRNLEFTLNIDANNKEARDFLNKISTLNLDEVFFINDMRIERKINTFLRTTDEAVFLRLRELRNKW